MRFWAHIRFSVCKVHLFPRTNMSKRWEEKIHCLTVYRVNRCWHRANNFSLTFIREFLITFAKHIHHVTWVQEVYGKTLVNHKEQVATAIINMIKHRSTVKEQNAINAIFWFLNLFYCSLKDTSDFGCVFTKSYSPIVIT